MPGIVEQLELDTSPALRSIGDIERALAGAAGTLTSAVSEAISEASDTPVALEGDASAVQESIEDATSSADTSVTVEDADAGAVSEAIESEVSSADSLVVVEGDASSLVQEIESGVEEAASTVTDTINQALEDIDPSAVQDLGGAFSEAGGESDNLANKLSGLGVITTAATGGTKNLGAALGALGGPVVAGAAAAVTGLAVGANKLSGEAEEAYLATQRFNATFGESARIIEQIDIGGLNISLSELALNLGSDDDAIREAAASLGVLSEAAGATEAETAEYIKTVIALTAQIVAANPALGSIGDNLGTVALALSGNARAGRRYGIALTEAEVITEALAVSGGKAADQLDLFDKSAAGARIRSKELGDTIAGDVNKALDNSTQQLKKTNQQLAEARERFGEKLRGPVAAIKTEFAGAATQVLDFTSTTIESAGILFRTARTLGGRIGEVGDELDKVGVKAGKALSQVKLAPVINSFSDLQTAVANTPGELTKADIALFEFTKSAVSKLPTISAAFESASSASQTALDGLIGKLPTVGSVFAEFAEKPKISIREVTKALDQQVKDQEAFFSNIQKIIAKGGADVAQQYLDMGPTEGAALAAATAKASEKRIGALEAATDAAIAANEAGQEKFSLAAQAGLVEKARKQLDLEVKNQEAFYSNVQAIIDKGGIAVARQILDQGIEQGAALASAAAVASRDQVAALETSTLNAAAALERGADELLRLGYQVHLPVGEGIGQGIGDGLTIAQLYINREMTRLIQNTKGHAAKIAELDSPSKLFAREIGKPIAEGIAVGINQGNPAIAQAINQAIATGSVPAGSPNTGPNAAGSSSVQNNNFQLAIPTADPEAVAFAVASRLGFGARR